LCQRGQVDRMEAADLEFHQRVRQGFQHLAQQDSECMVRIDAAGTEAEVARAIQTVVRDRILESDLN
ncbi:MAG: dTMP kinase, partial [Cyanobacteria bacterium P01_H01_bin.121]